MARRVLGLTTILASALAGGCDAGGGVAASRLKGSRLEIRDRDGRIRGGIFVDEEAVVREALGSEVPEMARGSATVMLIRSADAERLVMASASGSGSEILVRGGGVTGGEVRLTVPDSGPARILLVGGSSLTPTASRPCIEIQVSQEGGDLVIRRPDGSEAFRQSSSSTTLVPR